ELDTSQIDDQRGRRRLGSRGGLVALGGGGGLIGVVIVLVLALLGGGGGDSSGLSAQLDQLLNQTAGGGGAADVPSTLSEDCQTGADANEREDCRIVAVVNSVQRWWEQAFDANGARYERS